MGSKKKKDDATIVCSNPKEKIIEILKKAPKEKFLTEAQKEYWDILDKNQITLCSGPAGTGKSYISIKKAVDLIFDKNNKYEKILIIRPAVESEEKLGSLPGSVEEKLAPYIYPSLYLFYKIISKETTEKLRENGIIEVVALAHLRGYNIDNAIVIGEEFQNSTVGQMKLMLTRIGFNSKFFISGDLEQSDKFKNKTSSGLHDAKVRLNGLTDIGTYEFNINDIVRNPLITEILKRYD